MPLPQDQHGMHSRPLRAVKACVRDDRLSANVAAIKDADAGIPLQAICGRPEARHEFTLLCHTR